MRIPDEWQNYAKNKVDEILGEVKDSCSLRAPVPIREVIESYVGDVHMVVSMDSKLFPEGVSAFSTKDMNLGWIVVVNATETVDRQRFSAAHELAHIALFKNQASKVFCSLDSRDWYEKLCDQFAGDILMPEALVGEIYRSTPSPYLEDIAKAFRVSRPVAEIQLKRLRLPFIRKETRF